MATDAPPSPPSTLRIEIAPKTIALVLGAVATVWVLGQLTNVLMVVTVALILVGTFDPLVAWLEQRGFPRGRALVLVFIAATVILTGVVLLMVPPLASQLIDLIASAPEKRAQLIERLNNYGWSKPLVQAIEDVPLEDIGARAGALVLGYSTRLLTLIGYGITTLFLAIYLLADPVRSKGLLYSVVSRHHHVKLAKIL
ncbi:MAG: AI-2E family transporter, partial [Kofleriaceae bacterium]